MSTTLQVKKKPELPSIYDNPKADVVIFDGECNFCRAQVERLAWWDETGKRLGFVSLHDPEVARRYPDLTYDMLMEQMYVVDRYGHRFAGVEAIRYLTRTLPRLYWLAPVLHLPGTLPIWKWCYSQIAKRRYLLMGRHVECDGGTCALHNRPAANKPAGNNPA
jgi:predicted DCC family thiol-disulfide oxidoreductase YuxK